MFTSLSSMARMALMESSPVHFAPTGSADSPGAHRGHGNVQARFAQHFITHDRLAPSHMFWYPAGVFPYPGGRRQRLLCQLRLKSLFTYYFRRLHGKSQVLFDKTEKLSWGHSPGQEPGAFCPGQMPQIFSVNFPFPPRAAGKAPPAAPRLGAGRGPTSAPPCQR